MKGEKTMVNLLIRKPESPKRRLSTGWPFGSDFESDFFSNFPLRARNFGESMSDKTWSPSVDIIEKPDKWIFKAELPEINLDDISVTVEEGVLSIKGERKFEEEVEEGNYTRIERQYGSFERRFSLPSGVNAEDVTADIKNGILTLDVPKKEEAKPKTITINVK